MSGPEFGFDGKMIAKLGALIGGVALLISIAAIGAYTYHFHAQEVAISPEKWGQFGDYFGGVLNPALAFLALVALLLTLHIQTFELKQSTAELKNSAVALAKQNDALALQNFENAFFQMVKLHNDIVAAIDLRSVSRKTGQPRVTVGRDCFKVFYARLRKAAAPALRGDSPQLSYLEAMQAAYGEFHDVNEQNIGHYFRNLYRAFKFIDDSDVPDKEQYTGILRAQLSTFELALLFYNGISNLGEKFPNLIESYRLFENMRTEHLFRWTDDRRLYERIAFGDQRDRLDWN